MDWKNKILNPKWWLIITAFIHIFVGMLSTYDSSNDNETFVLGIMLIIPVYMLYAAFMTEGQAQARLAAILCGPMFVWFVLSAALGLEMLGDPAVPMPQSIMPLVLWGMPALSGLMGWNMDDAAPAAEA